MGVMIKLCMMYTLGTEEEMASSTQAEWSGGLQGKGSTVKVWEKSIQAKKAIGAKVMYRITRTLGTI